MYAQCSHILSIQNPQTALMSYGTTTHTSTQNIHQLLDVTEIIFERTRRNFLRFIAYVCVGLCLGIPNGQTENWVRSVVSSNDNEPTFSQICYTEQYTHKQGPTFLLSVEFRYVL